MKFVPGAVQMKIARQLLVMDKNSPQILFGAGVAGMLTSTVLACRATLKIEEVLDKAVDDRKKADMVHNDPDRREEYSEKDYHNDLRIIKIRTAGEIVKLYSPSLVVGSASIMALAKSHDILNKRNAALGAAYMALDKGFNEYRRRVVERYGDGVDREMRYGTRSEQVVNEENGKKETHKRVGDDEPAVYARLFDHFNGNWQGDADYNVFFLRCQQNYFNDLLQRRGHVFLNEVYENLGLPHSKAGSVVGWVYNNPNGDNYIDFGIFIDNRDDVIDFVRGRDGSFLLDFNVDGVIYDMLDTPIHNLS